MKIIQVNVDYLHRSPTNPRKTFNEADIEELAKSILEVGLLNPLTVRTIPAALVDDLTQIKGVGANVAKVLREQNLGSFRLISEKTPDELKAVLRENGMSKFRNPTNWPEEAKKILEDRGDQPQYEVIAGERRLRALRWIAATDGVQQLLVDCHVKEASDQEVVILQVTENLQRKEVNPVEEAEGIHQLEKAGVPIEEIAERLGRSTSFVAKRLSLMNLTDYWKEMLADDRLQVTVAIHISRLQKEQQTELEDMWFVDEGDDGKPRCSATAAEVRDAIKKEFYLTIQESVFDPNDLDLNPEMGACTGCPHNTNSSPVLFSDMQTALCTNPDCFDIKLMANARNNIESYMGECAANDIEPIFLSDHWYLEGKEFDRCKEKFGDLVDFDKVIKTYSFTEHTEESEGESRLAIYVHATGNDKSKIGTTLLIKWNDEKENRYQGGQTKQEEKDWAEWRKKRDANHDKVQGMKMAHIKIEVAKYMKKKDAIEYATCFGFFWGDVDSGEMEVIYEVMGHHIKDGYDRPLFKASFDSEEGTIEEHLEDMREDMRTGGWKVADEVKFEALCHMISKSTKKERRKFITDMFIKTIEWMSDEWFAAFEELTGMDMMDTFKKIEKENPEPPRPTQA